MKITKEEKSLWNFLNIFKTIFSKTSNRTIVYGESNTLYLYTIGYAGKFISKQSQDAILRNLPKKFKYIARDKDEELYLYKAKPVRSESIWNCLDKNYIKLSVFNHMFKFIKWNDEEPYNIEELLKED